MNDKQFKKYYDKYYTENRIIQRIARKKAKNNYDLYEDLVQVGLITLWKLDLTKVKSNEDAYIRIAIQRRIIDYLRKTSPVKITMESLEAKLESGYQLDKDPETGRLRLIDSFLLPDATPKDFIKGKPNPDREPYE